MNWLKRFKTYVIDWWHYHYGKMSHEELQARIRADVTDEDVDRFLPPALRRYQSYEIHVARSFSKFPAGRFRSDGPYSGERFRDDFLVPALRDNPKVTVLLDGTMGYGSSFLEEVFGGLVQVSGFSANELYNRLTISSTQDPSLTKEAWRYIDEI